MKRMLLVMVLLLGAAGVRADEASYRRAAEDLMSATQAESIIAGWRKRYETQAAEVIGDVLQGRAESELSPAQREVVQRFRTKGREALEAGISWEKMREPAMRAYMEAFTESEARELAAFYRTPLGQKLLSRLPLVSDGIARAVRTQIDTMRPQLQKISSDFSAEFERAQRSTSVASSGASAAPARSESSAPRAARASAACAGYNPKVGCR